MVKNKTGGSGTKGIARKNDTKTLSRLRISECEEEQYAVVRKIFGGSRCEVLCGDLIVRQAIIRGKFTGKKKRGNIIQSNSIILVGLRNWCTKKDGKTEECDVLEVYSPNEIEQLKQRPDFKNLDTTIEKKDEYIFTSLENDDILLTDLQELIIDSGDIISIDDI
jgi:initiation factor 1A